MKDKDLDDIKKTEGFNKIYDYFWSISIDTLSHNSE